MGEHEPLIRPLTATDRAIRKIDSSSADLIEQIKMRVNSIVAILIKSQGDGKTILTKDEIIEAMGPRGQTLLHFLDEIIALTNIASPGAFPEPPLT